MFSLEGDRLIKCVRLYELFYTLKSISISTFVLQQFPTLFHNVMN